MRLTLLALFPIILFLFAGRAAAGGAEYTGQFDSSLVPNLEETERVIFKQDDGERLKNLGPFDSTAHFAVGKLLDPQTQQYSLLSYLVEEKGKDPVMYIDVNEDHIFTADEKYALKRNADDTYVWNTTAMLRVKEGAFKTCPVDVRYLKTYVTGKMSREDRLFTQSTEVLARGKVKVKGKDILVQYAYNFLDKKVDPQTGWLGVDIDGNGEIDMGNLSPEAAKAKNEEVVFRVGELYLSTKKADVAKNQIILREHDAKDYKRNELYLNKDFPDFSFTDFEGKKHRFYEFHGKYVLLDVWGFWCGPCRQELPYIREAARRFESRNLLVIGLNTDEDYSIESMKKSLRDNQMTWTQGQFQSVVEFLRRGLRVNSFPTTFLISPEGKILSMGRTEREEPDLRGSDLLKSLNEILPKP